MSVLGELRPIEVFHYFEDICAIPHGSGNVKALADYCVNFANERGLKVIRDDADNVIIYKEGTNGSKDPVILQGHLDMVCQKDVGFNIDFEKDGLEICVDGDNITAKGTTLGADNGIAVAMVLAILASDDLKHPPLEAVFTSDEEIGMIGAGKLDMSLLSSKRMINLDSEDEDTVTVSCAGGSDFAVKLPYTRCAKQGYRAKIELKGLQGGHSGVSIDKGRVNANILLGRIFNALSERTDFEVISVFGGDKANAITNYVTADLLVFDNSEFCSAFYAVTDEIKKEISAREPEFSAVVTCGEVPENVDVIDDNSLLDLIFILGTAPNGVMEMSAEINGLVETSLNLGILETQEREIYIHFALRSNKLSALKALEDKLYLFFGKLNCNIQTFGHYPTWEYKTDSSLRETYIHIYNEILGASPKIKAIHAGLECGVFACAIKGLDCIAIGPQMYDVHTTGERLLVSSTQKIFKVLTKTLENL